MLETAIFIHDRHTKSDPEVWLDESRYIAVESVYTTEILSKLELVSRGMVSKPEVIELTESCNPVFRYSVLSDTNCMPTATTLTNCEYELDQTNRNLITQAKSFGKIENGK